MNFKKTKNIERKIKLNTPMMPNFITYNSGPVKKQDGFRSAPSIPVSDLSEDEAEEYGELMKQAFISHWKNKVAAKGSI